MRRRFVAIIALLLAVGCEDDRAAWIRSCKERGVPYTIGESEDAWNIKYLREQQATGNASRSQLDYLRDHTEAGE